MGRTSAQLGASWTPLGRNLPFQAALQAQLGASWAQLGPPSRTPSATWRFLGRFLVLLQPSESSSRLDESSILMVQAFLQSKRSWTAISHLFGLNLDLSDAAWAQLGASWAPLGLNLEPLGRLLDSTWGLLGASWADLVPIRPKLGALGRNLIQVGRFLVRLQPSKSSSRLGGSLIFMFLQYWVSTGPYGPNLDLLAASWAEVGCLCRLLDRCWALLWSLLGSTLALLARSWSLLP